ncbi:MAG TPA: zinc ribbon domain-containing protein [Candidatus Polarisedimenticolia bacterium]|nr:zinc ribbon domain-containing protein [Candidatus Polarisedimenticolia bacterium]
MSKFQEVLGVIPRAAKAVAAIISVGLAALILHLAFYPPRGSGHLSATGKVVLPVLAFAITFTGIMLFGYIYGDAKRRGMRYVLWTLLAFFVPYAIGIILYFILREPLPSSCPTCRATVLSKYTFCPSCGTPVRPVCPQCGKRVEIGWSNCGNCGTKLPDVPPRAA